MFIPLLAISILGWFNVLVGLPPCSKNETVGSSNVAQETIGAIFVEEGLSVCCNSKASVLTMS